MKIIKIISIFILVSFFSLILWSFLYSPTREVTPMYSWLSFAADLPYSDKTVSLTLGKNQTEAQLTIDSNDQEKPVYYSLTNLGVKTIKPRVIINGQDWFSDEAILGSALKNLDKDTATNQEKVLAVFKFITDNQLHWYTPLYGTSY